MTRLQASIMVAMVSAVCAALVMGVANDMGFVHASVTTILVCAIVIAALISALVHWRILGVLDATSAAAAASASPALADFSTTDPLTRTMNVRGITISIMDAMALGERYGSPLSVAKLAVTGLAEVESRYGKDAADRARATVAAVVADALRMPDKVGRYAENDFIVVMPHTIIDDAARIAERLCKAVLDGSFNVDSGAVTIGVDIGVTQYHKGEDIESILARVAKGAEAAAQQGGNRVHQV
jgi:diguanylate cyclase (GGDEF)-like protein